MGNYYNSPDLAELLRTYQTDSVGIMKVSRKNVPKKVTAQNWVSI
jgi:hypothetical protein